MSVDLYTLSGWILLHVSCISIKRFLKKKERNQGTKKYFTQGPRESERSAENKFE